MTRRLPVIVLALSLIAAACSSEAASTTTTTAPATTTTPSQATSTTTQPAATSTTAKPALEIVWDGDEAAGTAVKDLYTWLGDRTTPEPDVPQDLLDYLTDVHPDQNASISGRFFSEVVEDMGTAGVAVIDDQDIMLLVDEGTGWRVVGAWFSQYDVEPWFGNPLRYVFVIGTDARPGEFQKHLRADSLHILASNIAERSGGVLGFPRDTYVEASYGGDKFTNVNAAVFTLTCGRLTGATVDSCAEPDTGQDEMVEIARGLSGLPLEGWIVTGFQGFQILVDAFGGVDVDVPFAMAEPKSQAYLSAGLQTLFAVDALAFVRNRTINGGDFTRSFHHGIVMLGALDGVLERGITALPKLLSILMDSTWTGLSLEDLLTVGASALLLDPDLVGNDVLPGAITTRGGASIVDLTDEAEAMFRDMDDGSLSLRQEE